MHTPQRGGFVSHTAAIRRACEVRPISLDNRPKVAVARGNHTSTMLIVRNPLLKEHPERCRESSTHSLPYSPLRRVRD